MEQHGGADDNVPAYHSRLMWRQLLQTGSNAVLSELAGIGHWFDEVMTTPALVAFYSEHLQPGGRPRQPLNCFVVLSANPGDTGPKAGIRITHLKRPEIIGRIEVDRQSDAGQWTLKTHNVEEFELVPAYLSGRCIIIDNEEICDNSQADSRRILYSLANSENWQAVSLTFITPSIDVTIGLM